MLWEIGRENEFLGTQMRLEENVENTSLVVILRGHFCERMRGGAGENSEGSN